MHVGTEELAPKIHSCLWTNAIFYTEAGRSSVAMRQAAVSLACKLMREPGFQAECPITPHLLALMVGDESEGVRRKVVREMKIDPQVSLEHLLSRARDVSARVRESAYRRLTQLELKLADVP